MDFISSLRQLAKSDKWQTLFYHFKESNGNIFENNSNFTAYQVIFLNFLYFYHNIYTDIALEEVDEIVLTHEIFEDAWSRYKRKKKMDDIKNFDKPLPPKREERYEKGRQESFSWIFKKPKK